MGPPSATRTVLARGEGGRAPQYRDLYLAPHEPALRYLKIKIGTSAAVDVNFAGTAVVNKRAP